MNKDILLVVSSIGIGIGLFCGILLFIMHKKAKKNYFERAYIDELNLIEIKQWFSEKIRQANECGVLLHANGENLKKYGISNNFSDNAIIQAVFNNKTNKIGCYREISFTIMSPKLKDLLDNNNGTIIIEK